MALGDRMKLARRNAGGMSQQGLADLIWVKKSRVSDVERGAVRPSAQFIAAVAWALNVSMEFLMGIEHDPRPIRRGPPFAPLSEPIPQEVMQQMG